MSAFSPVKTDETDSFFRAFQADAKIEAPGYRVVAFGNDEKAADAGLELILAGAKRARAAPGGDFGDGRQPLPAVGEHAVIVDGRNKPRCVARTTDVTVKPLSAVDDDFAWDDGAGTRDDWLAAFRREVGRDDAETVFQRFTIVWPRLFADDWKGPRLQ